MSWWRLSESVDGHGQPIDMTEWIVNQDHDLMPENIFNPFLNASDHFPRDL